MGSNGTLLHTIYSQAYVLFVYTETLHCVVQYLYPVTVSAHSQGLKSFGKTYRCKHADS